LRLFSFGGYGLALAALALVVFGAYDSYPQFPLLTFTFIKNNDKVNGVKLRIKLPSAENAASK